MFQHVIPRTAHALFFTFIVMFGLVSNAQADNQPVKIGWLSSLTGPLAAAAVAENKGVQYAVDQINQSGGIDGRKIELITRDTVGDPTKAVNFAKQLVYGEQVDFIIGPVNSGEALATIPVVASAGVPNIIIGTVDRLTDPEKYPLAFRVINTNTQWIREANKYAIAALERKKVAVIGDTTGYGAATAKAAVAMLEENYGITPVFTALVPTTDTDVVDVMMKAREAGANVVMPWSAATGLLARLLNARGRLQWDVPVVGHPALMGGTVEELLNKPEYWNNVYGTGYVSTTYEMPGGLQTLPEPTQELMKAMHPRLPGDSIKFTFWWVAMGYDAVKVIEYAVEAAGSTDPQAIREVLESTDDLKGVYADYDWGPDDHNGFPDAGLIMDRASTFKEGSFQAAPY